MNETHSDAWRAAVSVMERLREAGYTAYLAGGCVRDRLLGRVPKDYDVATNARPEEVQALYPKSRMVGAKFGVVLVRRFGHDVEVATFRTDGVYTDGRRPDAVSFGTEVDDARRRDFTINGLFYDPAADQVIDYVGGQSDLAAGIIRTIGDPELRFAEDHLRMLRAVRLSARLGFPIEPATAQAIVRLAPRLSGISPERIWMELELILTEPTRAAGWRLLEATGLRAHLSPAWPPDPQRDGLAGRRLAALPAERIDPALALSAALADAFKPKREEICLSFRLSNRMTSRVAWLAEHLPSAHQAGSMELADFKALRANEDWESLLELLRVDLAARGQGPHPYQQAAERGRLVSASEAAPTPLLTGEVLLDEGIPPGPRLGEILRQVYRAQLNGEIQTAEQALALARKIAEAV